MARTYRHTSAHNIRRTLAAADDELENLRGWLRRAQRKIKDTTAYDRYRAEWLVAYVAKLRARRRRDMIPAAKARAAAESKLRHIAIAGHRYNVAKAKREIKAAIKRYAACRAELASREAAKIEHEAKLVEIAGADAQ